jgi:hypothetical protein
MRWSTRVRCALTVASESTGDVRPPCWRSAGDLWVPETRLGILWVCRNAFGCSANVVDVDVGACGWGSGRVEADIDVMGWPLRSFRLLGGIR